MKSRFKPGDKVRCVDSGGFRYITPGREYHVVEIDDLNVKIYQDRGVALVYPASLFELATDHIDNEKKDSETMKFTAAEFNQSGLGHSTPYVTALKAAEIANAKLEQWLSEATVVYGQGIEPMKSAMWCMNGPDFDRYKHTHCALLVNIEELPKEPCKHEPLLAYHFSSSEGASVRLKNGSPVCCHCGVPLKAKWEAT